MTHQDDQLNHERLHERSFVVTGGAGFIGRVLVSRLLSAGARVTVLDDGTHSHPADLAPLIDQFPSRFRLVMGSVLDADALAYACEGADTVVHLAALISVAESIEQPERYAAVNTMGTTHVLEAAKAASIERVVYASSAAVYGSPAGIPITEDSPLTPVTPYAATKLSGEHLVASAARSQGLPGLSLRFFNVYGEGQPADSAYASVIPAFCRAVIQKTRPTVFGDGAQTRDFVHVDDVVSAIICAATLPKHHDAFTGQAINIGSGTGCSILDLAYTITRLADQGNLEPELRRVRDGDVLHSVADTSVAQDVLGHRVGVTLEDGLARVLASMRSDQGGHQLRLTS